MNFFEEATLRLKQELNVKQDREVSALLGLSPTSWAGRKTRGLFPEKEVLALKGSNPDLKLDITYVMTGTRQSDSVAQRIGALPARIREARGRRSSAAFAKLIGTDETTLAKIEQGTQLPDHKLMFRIVETNPDIDANWLMGGAPTVLAGELSAREAILITNYRNLDSKVKRFIEQACATAANT